MLTRENQKLLTAEIAEKTYRDAERVKSFTTESTRSTEERHREKSFADGA
jgi:hypothetical protein